MDSWKLHNKIAINTVRVLSLSSLFVLWAVRPAFAEDPPPGSYQESCVSYGVENANLWGWCRNVQGTPIFSYLENYKECSDPPWNSNGILRCNKGNMPPSGSYRDSCEDIWVEAGNLHAKCKDMHGNTHDTALNDFAQCIDPPWNYDGNLRCNKGDIPPLGPYHNHCDDIWVEYGNLHARCGSYNKSYLVLKNYFYCTTEPNYDHQTLFCNKGDHLPPPGSYQKSCTSYWVEFENLFGICFTSRGSKYWTYLEDYLSCSADIANIDGTLRCWDNQTPTFTSTPEKTAYVGELYRYQVRATDADGDPLTFSLDEHPTGMAFNPQSGLIEWMPVESQIGKRHVTVKVDDGRFGVSTQSFDIDVTQAPQARSFVTYEMRSTARCTASLRFTWRPVNVHQNGSGSDVEHSDPQTGFSFREAIPSADNICQFQSQLLTPLRLGRWNISVESPYGTLMQCDVELTNGENRTTFTVDNRCSNITVGGSRGIQNPFGEIRP
jgi:hypothetical protein